MGNQANNSEEEEDPMFGKRKIRIESGRLFGIAVRSHNTLFTEGLILWADPETLNDALCIALDSIWWLRTQQQLHWITELMKKIIAAGAHDFKRALLRTTFIASCVLVCRSGSTSFADTSTAMTQGLQQHIQQCKVDQALKAKIAANVQNFTEWSMQFTGSDSCCQQGNKKRVYTNSSVVETQLQLSAFKTFLDLAGNHLSGKDFTEAFDGVCFPIVLFSRSFHPGWASGISATAVQGLLVMLVERGADNLEQCFFRASRFGNTELLRILLQIAQRNNLDIDVNHALDIASLHCKIDTMEFLVEEGNAVNFLGPFMKAARKGCMQVVEWFVKRGCQDMELLLALTIAISSSQVGVAAYLLPHVPQHVLAENNIKIIMIAGKLCGGSLDGVAFLLRSDFLGDPAATYAVADSIARSNDEDVAPELRAFLREHWSEEAFLDGLRQGQVHYMNLVTILKWSESPTCCYSGKKTKKSATCLRDLPGPLRVEIAYRTLYRECIEAGGCLLPQRLRGQLVEAVRRLGGGVFQEVNQGRELLAVLEHHLPTVVAL